jgi:hypothetical protein
MGQRITIREGKTKSRVFPMTPELNSALDGLLGHHDRAGSGCVFKRLRGSNLGTQAKRIIKRAGLTPWPRIFHNLRASCETDLVKNHPLHVACAWIGNSEIIAKKHYLQVTDEDYARAASGAAVSAGQHRTGGEPAMQNPTGNSENGDRLGHPWGHNRPAVSTEKQQKTHEALQQALHPLRNPKFKGEPDLDAALGKIRRAASPLPHSGDRGVR